MTIEWITRFGTAMQDPKYFGIFMIVAMVVISFVANIGKRTEKDRENAEIIADLRAYLSADKEVLPYGSQAYYMVLRYRAIMKENPIPPSDKLQDELAVWSILANPKKDDEYHVPAKPPSISDRDELTLIEQRMIDAKGQFLSSTGDLMQCTAIVELTTPKGTFLCPVWEDGVCDLRALAFNEEKALWYKPEYLGLFNAKEVSVEEAAAQFNADASKNSSPNRIVRVKTIPS